MPCRWIFRECCLKHGNAQGIDRCHWRWRYRASWYSKRSRLRENTVQVLTSAIAIQQLIFFVIGKPINQTLIDDRAQLTKVIKDLARSLHPMSNDLGRSLHQVEFNIR